MLMKMRMINDHARLHQHSRDLLPHDAQRQGGVPGQTHKGFEQSSCKIDTGLFGQTLHASTTRSERLVPAMGYTA